MAENKPNLNWSAVEKALAEGTFSGYKVGILETEKLFGDFLEGKKIPGRIMETKIKYAKNFLSRSEQLTYARQIYEKIVSQPHFEISREETKQVVSAYWQAMLDLEEAISTLSVSQKTKLRFKYFFGQFIKKIKLVGLILAIVILLILFLYELPLGNKIAIGLGNSVHFLIFTVGPWILGAAIAFGIFWLGLKILKKKRKEF